MQFENIIRKRSRVLLRRRNEEPAMTVAVASVNNK